MLFIVYLNMSVLAAIAGIVFTARMNSCSTMIGNGFEGDAIAACFIPVFSEYLTQRGKKEAFRFGSNFLSVMALLTAVLTVLGILFAQPLVTCSRTAMTRRRRNWRPPSPG